LAERFRAIALVDFDYFYAQCEELRHPEYRDKPIAVCMLTSRDSGAVASANYVARKSGVKSGMPVSKAKSLAPDIVILPVDTAHYQQVSSSVMNRLREEFRTVEQASIDEAYIDLGELSKAEAETAGVKIKQIVKEAGGIKCTVGIGPSKLIAKMASDKAKPDGLMVISPEEVDSFLESSKLEEIPYIGHKTAEKLGSLGIKTVSEARSLRVEDLIKLFGEKKGIMIYKFLRGIDERKIELERKRKEFEKFVSLKGKAPEEALAEAARKLYERLGGKSFREVGVIVIFDDLTARTRSKTFKYPVSSFEELLSSSVELLRSVEADSGEKKIRRVAVKVSRFEKKEGSLLDYLS
jgi:DNA polymerase IV (DinB-like DNA polymerase)